jgi:hypothetical protein
MRQIANLGMRVERMTANSTHAMCVGKEMKSVLLVKYAELDEE